MHNAATGAFQPNLADRCLCCAVGIIISLFLAKPSTGMSPLRTSRPWPTLSFFLFSAFCALRLSEGGGRVFFDPS